MRNTKIITLFNQKGGCGKSTVSVNVAGTLGAWGNSVLLVDMDKQLSASQWARMEKADPTKMPVKVEAMGREDNFLENIEALAPSHDFIFIDMPPSVDGLNPEQILTISDLVVIPTNPSPLDLWAAQAARGLVLKARELNPDLKAVYLINKGSRTNLNKDIEEFFKEDEDIQLLDSSLSNLIAFAESPLLGTTVHKVRGSKKASEEINALTNEILTKLGVNNGR